MTYPKISALVPEKEHFDETAITGEGVWLSVAHVSSIEKSIADAEVAILAKDATIKEKADANQQLTADLATEKATNETLTAENATQATRIQELEAKVTELGKRPSGKGSALPTPKDETPEGAQVPAYLDDASPENEWFDKQAKYR